MVDVLDGVERDLAKGMQIEKEDAAVMGSFSSWCDVADTCMIS